MGQHTQAGGAYRRLETEIGSCGIAETGGADVAAPYVSALAAVVANSRVIAVTPVGNALPMKSEGSHL